MKYVSLFLFTLCLALLAFGPLVEASGVLADMHKAGNVKCAACHGKKAPAKGATVDNARCIACHGTYEKLASKSMPKEALGGNPHKSHLGPIECAICHRGHQPSETYCLKCHKNFDMKIPAGRTE